MGASSARSSKVQLGRGITSNAAWRSSLPLSFIGATQSAHLSGLQEVIEAAWRGNGDVHTHAQVSELRALGGASIQTPARHCLGHSNTWLQAVDEGKQAKTRRCTEYSLHQASCMHVCRTSMTGAAHHQEIMHTR